MNDHLDNDAENAMDHQDISGRLHAQVDGLMPIPDLGAVAAAADRHRRRTRMVGVVGAAAVVALGVGGFAILANRDVDSSITAPPVVTEAPAAADTVPQADGAVEPDGGDGADGAADDAPSDTDVPNTLDAGEPAIRDDVSPGPQFDPADEYLAQTTEIYRRTMPNGTDVHIRRSEASYGDLFGIDWTAPTGSAAECLGQPAVFIGDPAGRIDWVSRWNVRQWLPFTPEQQTVVDEVYLGEQESTLIVRSALSVRDIVIEQGGEVTDEAMFENGIAALRLSSFDEGQFPGDDDGPMLTMTVEQADGSLDSSVFPVYGDLYGDRNPPAPCQPPPPTSELPDAGEQPADPAAAEADIRSRHALLVDRSRSSEDQPDDLVDDDTGVAPARSEMEAGQYAESADAAEFIIDELVFTDPTTAWFRYTIVAPTGTFTDRFGQAIFNGAVWQISRQTICQDLSLAGGYCDGQGQPTPPLQPGSPDDLDEQLRAWESTINLYTDALSCNPLSPCGEFAELDRGYVEEGLPPLPDSGEQPADADATSDEISELMSTIFANGDGSGEYLDRIDDPTGVAEARAQAGGGDFSAQTLSAAATVRELVFTDPETAWFVYELTTEDSSLGERFGVSVRVDGVWKITRDTICQDLSLAGGDCGDFSTVWP